MDTLKDRLKELRKRHKYTQKEIANYLGISESAYGYYEQGRNEPSLESIIKLSDKYNVTTSYILGDTGNPEDNIDNKIDLEELFDKLNNTKEFTIGDKEIPTEEARRIINAFKAYFKYEDK